MKQLTKDINNKFVILGGDFNLPDINWEDRTVKNNSNICKSILDLMDDFSLEQLVNEPTRGNNTLDLCFTNKSSLLNTVSIVPGLSDHDIVIADFFIQPKFAKKSLERCTNTLMKTWQQLKGNWRSLHTILQTLKIQILEL